MKNKKDLKTNVVFDDEGYSDDMGEGPSSNAVIVPDFLPPPEALAKAMETNKITLALGADSLDFFKEKASELGVPYQRMIRKLLDEYVARHKGK